MFPHGLKISAATALLALAACGEPTPITDATRAMIVTFNGNFDGACRVEAPNGEVKPSRLLGSDQVLVRGGIATSTIVCDGPNGAIQTISHRNDYRAGVRRNAYANVYASAPGVQEVSALMSATGGEFSFTTTLTWTRR
jgi:hypothetical protein